MSQLPLISGDTGATLPPAAGTMKARILSALLHRKAWGGTCDELELQLGCIHQSLSARMGELRNEGHVVDIGLRRNTRSGHAAIAWVHIAVAGEAP